MIKDLINTKILQSNVMLIPKFAAWAKENGAKYLLTLGEPDFTTPEPIKKACIEAIEADKTKYSLSLGNLDFRERICAYEARVNGVNYEPYEVLITSGNTEGISAVLLTIINPGDEIIVLTPGYPLYPSITNFAGGVAISLDTSNNQFQVTSDMLESVITPRTKAIVITSPSNPTGTILNQDSLTAIAGAAKKHRFFMVADDCYNQIVFCETCKGIAQFEALKELIIICQSLSKSYAMTGWRLGYILATPELLEEVMKVHEYVISGVSTFSQDGGRAAMDYDPKDMVASYKKRRDYIYDRLIKMGLDVVKPEGAFYAFPSIKKFGLKSWDFCQRLVLEEQVAFMPGICFEADDFVRISYCVDMACIVEAMDRLERFIGRF